MKRSLAVAATAGVLTFAGATAAHADAGAPIGNLDGVIARGTTTLTVAGWALDRDRTSWAVRVQASVDGVDDPTATILASGWRPDVADPANGVTAAHGYVLQVQAPPTAQEVCVRVLNVAGTPGSDATLGCAAIPLPPRLVDKVDKVRVNVAGVGEVTSIQIYPTQAGRDTHVANLDVWNATKALHASHDFLADFSTPGMYEQFVCHRNFAPSKPSWNLEPGRVALDYWSTVAYACNPPFKPGAGS